LKIKDAQPIFIYKYMYFIFRLKYESKPLHPTVEAIKQKANSVFEKQQYAQAIILYNQAVALAPDAAVLYGNRAAAFMKRGWYVH
jgi:WD and tetratricopeptide repeat-containing protein 1